MSEPRTWEEGVGEAIRMIRGYRVTQLEWNDTDLRDVMDALIHATGNGVDANHLAQVNWDQLWSVFGAIGYQFWAADIFGSADVLAVHDLAAKQHDYGCGNIDAFGRLGLIVRAHDKVARIENLRRRGGEGKNEALADSYFDCLGYAAIALMWDRGWFHLPLADEADLAKVAA